MSAESRAPANPALQPLSSNTRVPCEHVMKRAEASEPVLACEQEFVVTAPCDPFAFGAMPAAPKRPLSTRSKHYVPLPHEVAGGCCCTTWTGCRRTVCHPVWSHHHVLAGCVCTLCEYPPYSGGRGGVASWR